MDVSLAESAASAGKDQDEDEDADAPTCPPCADQLNTLKGQGKGFQGYCSFCWGWDHNRANSTKRLAPEGGKGGKSDGKGDKDERKGGGFQKGAGFPKGGGGGWQTKGGKGKGTFGNKGGKGGGFAFNIDGDDYGSWGGWGQDSDWNSGYVVFGSLKMQAMMAATLRPTTYAIRTPSATISS